MSETAAAPAVVMVQDYQYTVPRRPIAAMFASPGPALYTMPTLVGRTEHDPRSVHVRYPAYSLASRVYMHKQDHSPGPKYFPHSKVVTARVSVCPSVTTHKPVLCRCTLTSTCYDEMRIQK